MTFTYTPGATPTDAMRLLIPDRVQAEAIFSDEELGAFLTLAGDVRRSAALALETIASDEALVQKVVRIGAIQTDGAKTAQALLARAKELRMQADAADAADGAAFDIAEWVTGPFSARERIYNDALRQGG